MMLRIHEPMRQNSDQQIRDYQRVERAIQFLHQNFRDHPSLEEIAQAANLSPHHFQRFFTRWAGVSPTRFMQALSLKEAKKALAQSESIFDASLTAKLSGPGRLHDLFVTFEAMTPGDFKIQGKGLKVRYGGLAKAMGMPRAARAVGSAIGANPVAYVIPWHRAIRATGLIKTNYRWGPARKLAMIGREAAEKNVAEKNSPQP